jgi:thiamine-phosphate pyrophosphorylase
MKVDYSLYLVTDRGVMRAPSLEQAVEQAVQGGCTMVQLREKQLPARDFYSLAVRVKAVTDRHGVPLLINDRVDIALAVGAAGVHIGQKDLPVSAVRRVLSGGMLLGVSAATVEEALRAQESGADYLGVGAMYPTDTKTDARPVALAELRRIRQAVRLPIVAIGGLSTENAVPVLKTGVDGLAVVSAVLARPDIRSAAADLRRLILEERGASHGGTRDSGGNL